MKFQTSHTGMFAFSTTNWRLPYFAPHVGRYLFRHKGKKIKGRPNYPEFRTPLRRTHRYCNKADRGQRLRDRVSMREMERSWARIQREQRRWQRQLTLIEKAENVVHLHKPVDASLSYRN